MKKLVNELTEEALDCVVGGAFVLKWSHMDADTIICTVVEERSRSGPAEHFSADLTKANKVFTNADFKKYVADLTEKYKNQDGLQTKECPLADIINASS